MDTDSPSFASVYLLTQRNAEAIQKLGERLNAMAVREEQRQIEADKRDQERKAELNEALRDSQRRINKLDELFTSQWGKLVEALVDGKVVELLNGRGIEVEQTSQRCEGVYEGKTQEIDILAINGTEIVAVEVKTTLRPEDIGIFENKLKVLKLWMRQYAEKKIYGAVAYIRAVGESARLINSPNFKPRSF